MAVHHFPGAFSRALRTFTLLAALSGSQGLQAQQAPAPPQTEPVAIIGAAIHLGNGRVIPDGVVLFENGRITAVDERSRNTEWEKDRYRQIMAEGKHLYPGLIAMFSTLGLNEIEAVRPTQDFAETGTDNPNARAIIAYNTDSRVIPTLRSNGVLLSQIVPRSGRWPGMSAVVQLDAWNWEDAAYAADEGIFLQWPVPYQLSGRRAEAGDSRKNKEYAGQVMEIDRFMKEAWAYVQDPAPAEKNLRFEVFKALAEGKRRLYIRADYALAIQDAVHWAASYGITPVIVGGRDSWMVADLLRERGVAVVLLDIHRLPETAQADIDLPFRTPALLRDAGVLFAIAVDGFWQQRNLAFQAGQTVAYGLSRDEALAAITSSPARIMGLEKRTGTIAAGLDANLILSSGDLLDIRSSRVEAAFIQGREVDLDNHHKQLYRRYRDKYRRDQ